MLAFDYARTVEIGQEARARAEESARRLRIRDFTDMMERADSPLDAATNILLGIIGDDGLDAATARYLTELAHKQAARAAALCACVNRNAPVRLLEAAE
jgi:hypothetical protein